MGNVPVPTRGAFEFPGRYKLYPEALLHAVITVPMLESQVARY